MKRGKSVLVSSVFANNVVRVLRLAEKLRWPLPERVQKCLHLIGGTFDPTGETRDLIASISVECSVHQWGIMDEQDMDLIAGSVGTWDILILNATFLGSRATVAETSIDEWWQSFEVRIRVPDRPFTASFCRIPRALLFAMTVLRVQRLSRTYS